MTKPQKLVWGIGAAALVTAIAAGQTSGTAVAWLLACTSFSCLWATLAYATNRPGMHGKRQGRLIAWRALPSAIFLLAFRIACALMRARRRHPAISRVTPWLWVGGHLRARDVPNDLDFVVDLVAEFSEPRPLRERPGYRFLPVLDGHVPPHPEPVLALLDELSDPNTRVLVHCDSGIGRAPTMAALLLLRRGAATTLADAIATVERARPFVHFGNMERAFLEEVAPRAQTASSRRAGSRVPLRP